MTNVTHLPTRSSDTSDPAAEPLGTMVQLNLNQIHPNATYKVKAADGITYLVRRLGDDDPRRTNFRADSGLSLVLVTVKPFDADDEFETRETLLHASATVSRGRKWNLGKNEQTGRPDFTANVLSISLA